MKWILLFLVKFFILSTLISAIWWTFGDQYNHLLTAGCNLFFAFFKSEYSSTPNGTTIDIYREKANELKRLYVKIDARSLHYNLIPLIALFIATSTLPLKKRLLFLLISLLILYFSHIFHINLDIYKVTEHRIPIYRATFWQKLGSSFRLMIDRVIYITAIFWEQLGSMILPFFLWLIFFGRSILLKKNELFKT